MVRQRMVSEYFHLNDEAVDRLYELTPRFGFNGYGEIVYYRTFARKKQDSRIETWNDTCLRVINGIMTIRKNHYFANNIEWDEAAWQKFAEEMLISMFNMEWLPPGRGLWQCGTDFMYERGSAALNNCGFTEVRWGTMHDDMAWSMDMLMLGVGVGFRLNRPDKFHVHTPKDSFLYSVPDTREGWANSVRLLIMAFTHGQSLPIFDYSQVRKQNMPISGFGGTASGPDPLRVLHDRIKSDFESFILGRVDVIELMANIANAIAVAVLAGNVRRSAEILQCEVEDDVFINLKDEALNPHRADISWTSNNSAIFSRKSSFGHIGRIAERVGKKGEPGGINEMNLRFARLNPKDIMAVINGLIRSDKARGFNPCGEQQLEDRELCCLVNTFVTRCLNATGKFCYKVWQRALDFATFYATTVTLLQTHSPRTNAVMQRNRRIGVAISDFTGWVTNEGMYRVIDYLKDGYDHVRTYNALLADEAGVPHSIRVTTIKPDGTVTKLAGVTSGAGYPTFRHTLRRTRCPVFSPVTDILIAAGIPHEPDVMQPESTLVFETPILQGPAPPVSEVSIWQQVTNIRILQRYWSDNAVSNTIYFEPDEYLMERLPGKIENLTLVELEALDRKYFPIVPRLEYDNIQNVTKLFVHNPKSETHLIETVIASMMPDIKSFSLLPKSGPGVYPQMPESALTPEEYQHRLDDLKKIDWSQLTGYDGSGVKYCDTDVCEVNA